MPALERLMREAPDVAAMLPEAAARHGVDAELLAGLVLQESMGNPRAVSKAGAKGLTQLMPPTQKELGVTDPFDPQQSLDGGAKYLAQLLKMFPDEDTALLAYNQGMGNVQRGTIGPAGPDYVRRIRGFMGQGGETGFGGGAQQQAAPALPAAPTGLPREPPPQPAPQQSAPTRIPDDYDSRRLGLGGQTPGQAAPSGFVPWDEPATPEAMWSEQSGAPAPGMEQWQPAPQPRLAPPQRTAAATPFGPPANAGAFAPPNEPGWMDAGGMPPAVPPSSPGFDSPLREEIAKGQFGPLTSPWGSTPEDVANSVVAADLAAKTGGPPSAHRYFGEAGASVGNVQWPQPAHRRGREPGWMDAGGMPPGAPPSSSGFQGFAGEPEDTFEPPNEPGWMDATGGKPPQFGLPSGTNSPPFDDKADMFRGYQPPRDLSLMGPPNGPNAPLMGPPQGPPQQKVKDAEMALQYHMKSYDPIGLLSAEQRQRSVDALTQALNPQQRQQEHWAMGLGRAFAAGGAAAGVEPLVRAHGIVNQERARQDALAAQADQQRRAQVGDLTSLLGQDRQARALDYQMRPPDTVTLPGMGEVPASEADNIMRAQWQGGAQQRWQSEQDATKSWRDQQSAQGDRQLNAQIENWESLDESRESLATARSTGRTQAYAEMVLRNNQMQRKADPRVLPISNEQAWQMALDATQEPDPNAPLDLNAAIQALGAKLQTNGQPSAGGVGTSVATGQEVDPSQMVPGPRR